MGVVRSICLSNWLRSLTVPTEGELMYQVTFVESGKTITLSSYKASKLFGRLEWKEIKANCLPHIVVTKIN